MKVAVVGGGLSGLAAAHEVRKRAPEAGLTVLEGSEKAGGTLGTLHRDGYVIETGPDSILSEKTAAVELATELGIDDQVIDTNTKNRGAFVVFKGGLMRVPAGFSLLAPTQLWPWVTTPMLSPAGKLRAAWDFAMPARKADEDESLGSFVRRRFGTEVLERLAQPLAGGIYGGDPDQLSLHATMPRFIEAERQAGSVIRGLRRQLRAKKQDAGTGARYGLFVAFRNGMKTLTDALADQLGERLRLNTEVRGLERAGDGWRLHLAEGTLEADRVLLALPAWRSAAVLQDVAPKLSDALGTIPYGSAATVTFAWDRDAIPHALNAFGFVVPAVEKRAILAATFSSVKWPGRAPDGKALIRVFIGGHEGQDAVHRPDDALIADARRELKALIGVEAEPDFSIVLRYRQAMPQYHLGHEKRVDAIEAMQEELPNLRLAGNAYRGVGIPDAIGYARKRAGVLLEA